MSAQLYCSIDGTEYGPVTSQDLKRMAASGKLKPDDLVKKSAVGKWVAAKNVKGLEFPTAPKPAAAPEKAPRTASKPATTSHPNSISPPAPKSCPGCYSVLSHTAVLCVNCGHDMRTGKKFAPAAIGKQNRRRIIAGAGVAVVIALSLGLWWNRGGGGSSEYGAANSTNLQTPPENISGPPPVKVASARIVRGSKSLSYPYQGSYRVWSLHLDLENVGRSPLRLGSTCALFECTSDTSAYEGVVSTRLDLLGEGGAGAKLLGRYSVGNLQYGNNDPIVAGSDSLHIFMALASSGGGGDTNFGILPPNEKKSLVIDFKLGQGMKDDVLSFLRVVTPMIYSSAPSTGMGGILVLDFTSTAADKVSNGSIWGISKSDLVSLEYDALVKMAQDGGGPALMRVVALNSLTDVYGKKAASVLRKRVHMRDEFNGNVRLAALSLIETIGDKESIDAIRAILSNNSEPVGLRRQAAIALGELKAAAAVEELARAVREQAQGQEKENLARLAIASLGKIGGPRALATLVDCLKNENALAINAAQALGEMRGPEALAILTDAVDRRQPPREQLVRALGGHRRTDLREITLAEARLIPLTLAGSEAEKRSAIEGLAGLDSPKAYETLTQIVVDRTQPEGLRWAASSALQYRMKMEPPVRSLLFVARDTTDPLRWGCLGILARCNSPDAQSTVQAALAETDEPNKGNRDSLKYSWERARDKIKK